LLTARNDKELKIKINGTYDRMVLDKWTNLENGEKHNEIYFNPLPLLFKSLLPGQEDCVFSSGHLN
jgi:hypothetical protein